MQDELKHFEQMKIQSDKTAKGNKESEKGSLPK